MSVAPAVDAGGLVALRAAATRGDARAVEDAAEQFEALFVGMLLKSARAARLGEGLDGAGTQQYLELMDAQVAQEIARRGDLGFGRMLVEQLGGAAGAAPTAAHGTSMALAPRTAAPAHTPAAVDASARAAPRAHVEAAAPAFEPDAYPGIEDHRERFVRTLWPHAQRAAAHLGVDPKLLIAQAALETGWGKAVPRTASGASTHNLFGIKAGASWDGARASTWTLEIVDGVPERRRADFRAYASLAESFADYADVIGRLPRYAHALGRAADPEGYARAVAEGGYATDPAYADKWLAVYRSRALAGSAQESAPAADNASVTVSSSGSDAARTHWTELTARMD